jgi:hypothetical protein
MKRRIQMKLKKITIITFIAMLILMVTNISKAYTLDAEDIKVKEGEEFTVTLNVSDETPSANGHIKFDSSKVEFVKVNDEKMSAAVNEDGILSWMYLNITSEGITEGTKSFEFVFKANSSASSELVLDDLAFVDTNGNEYTVDNIENAKTTIYINKKSNSWIFIVVIIAVIIVAVGVFVTKSKKSK